jgi:hypothetical protein
MARFHAPLQAAFVLTVNGKDYACTCRESPVAPGSAAYVEYARPESPIRLVVAPGDAVTLKLTAAWTTARRVAEAQTLFDGHFVVPAELHTMGSPGYNVDVPHLGTQMYLCAGNVGTPESFRTEIFTFHLTLLY